MATAKTPAAKAKKASPKKATSRAKPKTTARKRATKPKTAPQKVQEPERYVARNLTHLPFGFRLERQQDSKRRIDLKPRGQRGDFFPLQAEDLHDPNLTDQVNVGVIEIITATEAAKVAQKQTTNQQQVHPALAMLRNEYGEEYDEGAFTVDQSFEEQGVVVAELHDGQIAVDRTGIVRPGHEPIPDRRSRLRRPGDRPGGSPMVSQGGPIRTSPGNAGAAAADAKARKKSIQGPAAGIADGIKVTVAPTRRN